MQINQIFKKPVNRSIEGVIKANDESGLQNEVEEYVLTKEVSKHLNDFLESYLNYQNANGGWISGFFGSGKSHYLKMLALLIENRSINGKITLEYFLPKCDGDEFLKGNLKRAIAIPSRSLLFNIDQKVDNISKDDNDAVLAVFLKVFNEMCGFYGKWGYLAQFERDLVTQGKYEQFQQAYQEITGNDWKSERHLVLARKTQISRAYAQVTDNDLEHIKDIVKEYREDFKLSIEDFAYLVKDYIDEQEPGFRLNFFVDEVGQYVADRTHLMTNLQTIAESLATVCQGQAWIVVTAQEDMDKVIGSLKPTQKMDFSKIMARFKLRMKMTSANVDEVISTRLLDKNDEGKVYLEPLYQTQKNNFGTFFDFSEGSRAYRNFRDETNFVSLYPFIPYQFTLFQQCITSISEHNMFEGRNTAVGERSMLEVFQDCVKQIMNEELGTLTTFDRMYAGIESMLQSQSKKPIDIARDHLNDEFALRVLKALFLVKYVKEFKPTLHNLRVLLTESFDENLGQLSKRIEDALTKLELQTYIQRNGDEYEFLTNEEKDIEQEIKNTQVDVSEMSNVLKERIYDGILQTNRIRHQESGQDFDFTKKIDSTAYSREHELSIQIITPNHEHSQNAAALMSMSVGLPVLLVQMPPDPMMMRDLELYCQTEKYIKQSTTHNQNELILRILSEKRTRNQKRLNTLQTAIRNNIANATYYVYGTPLEIASQEPKTNIMVGFSSLIDRVYPNLMMLKGKTFTENEIWGFLTRVENTLFDQSEYEFAEAVHDLFSTIKRDYELKGRVTLYNLREKYEKRPYGWSLAAIQCLLAVLSSRGMLIFESDSNILEGKILLEALKNTHGFTSVLLKPQIGPTPEQIRTIKDFFNDFFDKPISNNDGLYLAKECKTAFQTLNKELEDLINQENHYPYLAVLRNPQQRVEQLAKQQSTYFLTDLGSFKDDLLQIKEDILDPIRYFQVGEQSKIYDECRSFLTRSAANFTSLNSSDVAALQAIIDDPNCYRGNQMVNAKGLKTTVEKEINDLLTAEKDRVKNELENRKETMRTDPDFIKLSKKHQEKFIDEISKYQHGIEILTIIATVKDSLQRFENLIYPRMLDQISQLANPPKETGSAGDVKSEPVVRVVSLNTVRVQSNLHTLDTEQDVDGYLAEFKDALMKEIKDGKRISL